MPAVVEFRGRGSYLSFTLIARPYPDDRDYFVTSVSVQTNDFRGGFPAGTWLGEWRQLRATLASLYSSVGQGTTAEGGFDEAHITLRFQLSRHGQLALFVDIYREPAPFETHLEFGIDADQSFLPLWIRAIDQALDQLPAE